MYPESKDNKSPIKSSVQKSISDNGGVVFGKGYENRVISEHFETISTGQTKKEEKTNLRVGISLNPASAMYGIILSEILGPPKALRRSKRGSG